MSRLAVAALAALACAVLAPQSALASDARVTGGTLTYVADPGETNAGVITLVGNEFVIDDPGAAMGTGPGCNLQAGDAHCDAGPVARIEITLGGGDDGFTLDVPLEVIVNAGAGADTLNGGGAQETLRGDEGHDLLNGGAGHDSIDGGADNDTVSGGDGNDALAGGAGDDSVNGGAGDDVLDAGGAGSGADGFAGGPGRDRLDYSKRGTGVSVTLDGALGDGEPGEGDNAGADIEDATGTPGADSIGGNALANALAGGGGHDSLTGGGGVDALDGGDGNDSLGGGEAADALAGGTGDDLLDGGDGGDTIAGGDGSDRATYAAVPSTMVRVTLDDVVDDGPLGVDPDRIAADVEGAVGGGAGDDLVGNAGANPLEGGGGEDFVDGGGGQDALAGGEAPDLLRSRDGGPDALDCGPGDADLAITDRGDTATGCEHVAFTGRAPTLGRSFVVGPVGTTATAATGGARGARAGPAGRIAQTAKGAAFGASGMQRVFSLQDRISLPIGSSVDASGGPVSLRASAGRGKGRPSGRFLPTLNGRVLPGVQPLSQMLVRQPRRRGAAIDLVLKGGDFGACPSGKRRAGAAQRRSARRVVRRMWGRARGRFRTRGRYSSATVRGTTWLTEDRCDGTLTRVRSGRVVVRDHLRRRVVTLRAGDSYLATPRGKRPVLDRARR